MSEAGVFRVVDEMVADRGRELLHGALAPHQRESRPADGRVEADLPGDHLPRVGGGRRWIEADDDQPVVAPRIEAAFRQRLAGHREDRRAELRAAIIREDDDGGSVGDHAAQRG